jgi:hypothetical protein
VAANAAASALAFYPFGVERLSIYLAPLVAIVIAHGTALLARRAPAGPLLASLVVALVFAPSAYVQARHLARPPVREEIRDFVNRLAREAAPGDTLFVAEDALSAFQFYWRRAGRPYPPDGLVTAARLRQDPARHRDETERLAAAGRPVWSLLTHMPAVESDTIASLMAERFQHSGMNVVGDARLDYWTPR